MKYPKIQTMFDRDPETNFKKVIVGQWAKPEFEYLQDAHWTFTEKVDGTNIRVMWDGERVRFGGRTDNAQIPTFLYDVLVDLFPQEKCAEVFTGSITLFGEGYGAKIQKGGGNYIPDGVDFILFDAWAGMWVERPLLELLAVGLHISIVPILGIGSLLDAVECVEGRPNSCVAVSEVVIEGLVLRPRCELLSRQGERIITKLKVKDLT
jgi:hypothetical protein